MGMMRKIMSVSTLGLVKFRSVREQNARSARIAAQAERERARTDRREFEARLREAAYREGLR